MTRQSRLTTIIEWTYGAFCIAWLVLLVWIAFDLHNRLTHGISMLMLLTIQRACWKMAVWNDRHRE